MQRTGSPGKGILLFQGCAEPPGQMWLAAKYQLIEGPQQELEPNQSAPRMLLTGYCKTG